MTARISNEIQGPYTIVPEAARTAAFTGAWNENERFRGAIFTIDFTTAGSPTVTFTLEGQDHLGESYDIKEITAITATGKTVFNVFPGASGTDDASTFLPRKYRITAAVGDATSATYSVGVTLLP